MGGMKGRSGRKPKSVATHLLHGTFRADRHAKFVPPSTPIEEFDPPSTLTPAELEVWKQQAPFALRNGTLTPATSFAFQRYCRLVVDECHEATSSAKNGLNHRGLRRDVNTCELQFMLTPSGRPIESSAPATPVDPNPLAKFRR
jgi:hypothetical protein